MEVTETASEGLLRQYKVTVGAKELEGRLEEKLKEMAPKMRLNGFRPGKVPVAYLKRTYGKSMMGEIVQETLDETSSKTVEERSLKTAAKPRIELDQKMKVEDVIAGKADLEFTLAVDLMPEFEPADLGNLAFERLTAAVSDEELNTALERLAASQRTYKAKAKTAKAKEEEQVYHRLRRQDRWRGVRRRQGRGRSDRPRRRPLSQGVRGRSPRRQGGRRSRDQAHFPRGLRGEGARRQGRSLRGHGEGSRRAREGGDRRGIRQASRPRKPRSPSKRR